ncbi:MAG: peptidoglycan DD-metalloendopeptidase family protein [Candidatus Eisenbacteria bacterium]|nr:peptidoglycan DD-metalloendopeptidase family protein [Candidatus Eisenbacteria bacterium]
MDKRNRTDLLCPSSVLARFNRLPETARFYSILSILVVMLVVASGFVVDRSAAGGPDIELNPRSPMLDMLSPWGRVMAGTGGDYLRSSFEVLGVVTPVPGDVASYDYVADPGEDMEAIAARKGIDVDLLASANSASYARVPKRKTEVRLPLLYTRDRSWDRSLEFLYPIAREAPIGGNGKAKKGAPTIVRHAVARGECLWNIAKKYHVRIETIVAMNDLPSARYLRPGQILEIPDTDGTYVNVRKGDTIDGICKKYSVEMTDLVNANPGVNVDRLRIGQKLFVPGSGALEQLFRFAWPVHGRISSRYGVRLHPVYRRRMMHTGLDIAARSGTPIRAALAGRVKFVGWKGGYGRTVILEHPNGYETLYGHCSSITCRTGQTIKRGERIGKVGSTGVSTGPHVHFEVKRGGKRMNPERVLY